MTEARVDRLVSERYQLRHELGRGGMGVVYLGRDLRREMDVAIKFRALAERDAALWLKREFRAVASLRHPNLVELYELVAHDGSYYFTMEYVAGVDPRRFCAGPDGAVDFDRVRAVIVQLAEALAFLHARGVIHRDVKPSNAIVEGGEDPAAPAVVKLLDFGLALARHRDHEDLAREERLLGTTAYLAPEYLENLDVSPALDVYALGVLAFELVTGAVPFGGALHIVARLARALTIPRAASRNPATPPDLDDIIAAMLAAAPADRPTASEIVARLGGAIAQPRPPRREPRFVGRVAELARISARISEPAPRGRLIALSGPSGVGKTSVMDAVCAAHRTTVWRGRCHDRERVPYRAFDAIIDDLASELASHRERGHGISHAAALARVFPVLAAMFAPEQLAAAPAGDLRVERDRAQRALVELFGDLAPRGGDAMLLVIDDLQWADDASLELLALLVESCPVPLRALVSWTSGDADAGLRALLTRLGETAELVEIPAMPEPEVHALVRQLAPAASPAQLAAAARRAAGSPYLAQLIGRELADAPGAPADVDDPTGAEARRLARMTPAERAVAAIAAIADGSTTFDELRAVAELPSAAVSSALRGLADERVVRAAPSAAGDPVYVFYHQRLRDAAHAALPAPERRELHARFAAHLEAARPPRAEALAYHWEHAGDRPRAARWAIAAADAARAQLAWDVAAAGYARALALGAPATIRALRAECLALAGHLADAAGEFLVLAEGPELGSRDADLWRVRAAEAYIKLGEIARGLALLDPLLARHGQPRAHGRARSLLRAAGVAALWIARPGPRPTPATDEVITAAHAVLAKFLSTPFPIESLEYVLREARDAERRGDTAGASTGMAMVAAYLAAGTLGRLGDRALASARRLAAQSGAPYPAMVTAGCAGILAMLRGDWATMRAQHELGDRICRALGLERSWEASFVRGYWALGEHYAGQPARAVAMLAELADTSDDMISRAMLGAYHGRALLVAGDVGGARAIEAAIRAVPGAQQGMGSIHRQLLAGELALAEHDWAHAAGVARDLAASARAQWLSAMPTVTAMVDAIAATAAVGLAATGDREAADRARTIARRLHRTGPASFFAPTALRLWGQAERLRGQTDRADALLARAEVLAAHRGGAIEQAAIAALRGRPVPRDLGAIAPGVAWSTGGVVAL